VLVTVGAVRSRVLDRIVTRSRHVRVDGLREVVRLVRRPGGARGARAATTRLRLSDLTPPPTVMPLAPTFRRLPRRVTTTHDPQGGGSPRLLFPADSRLGLPSRVFYLKKGTTTIGSGPEADLVLEGIGDLQAEIRRNEVDEYVVLPHGEPGAVRVNGSPLRQPLLLRTGSRLELGRWTMSYFRSEEADHGRPYGGRIGGELGYQRSQRTPVYRPVDQD
jgi:hypothetical protein